MSNWKDAVAARMDGCILACCGSLLAVGLLMVYSSTVALGGGGEYLIRQMFNAAVGLGLGAMAIFIPLAKWRRASVWLVAFGIVMLVLVAVGGLGPQTRAGVSRWLYLGFFTFQPVEFVKFAAALYVAAYCVKQAERLADLRNSLRGLAPLIAVVGAISFLLLKQPDFGSFLLIAALVMTMMFLAGLRLRYLIAAAFVVIAAAAALVLTSDYRMQRFTAFLNPFADPLGDGYNQSHALMAFGNGGIAGVGLGRGMEKWSHLPEAHTDFIVSVIAEEWGFIGFAAVIAAYAAVVLRAFMIARDAAYRGEYFGALAAQGIAVLLALQVVINVGGNLSLLPAKGLTLPLLSYGGSSLAMTILSVGFLLRVGMENRQREILP